MKLRRMLLGIALIAPLMVTVAAENARGEQLLGIDVSIADGENFDTVFVDMLATGMTEIGLSLDWSDIETARNEYEGLMLGIANIYYPAFNLPVSLTLRPIHTGTFRVPDDLQNTSMDDPAMIARFEELLDFVFETTPNVEFSSLVIGSEIDVYLGTDADKWAEYTRFAEAVADYAREQRPGTKIAFEVTYNAFQESTLGFLQTLNQHADVVGVSYYPLTADFTVQPPNFSVPPPASVADGFGEVVAAFPDKPIYFYQLGYPSSVMLDSSEQQQAQFIRESFAAWDLYRDNIVMLDFTWLTDMSAGAVAYFEEYYKFSNPDFAAFLGSLGLRNNDGTDKAAMTALREEAAARGWSWNSPSGSGGAFEPPTP